MNLRSTPTVFSLFPRRSSFLQIFAAGLATAALIAGTATLRAQSTDAAAPAQAAPAATAPAATAPAATDSAAPQADLTLSTGKKEKKEKVVQSKDTRKELKKE
jgi:hypothetical protein